MDNEEKYQELISGLREFRPKYYRHGTVPIHNITNPLMQEGKATHWNTWDEYFETYDFWDKEKGEYGAYGGSEDPEVTNLVKKPIIEEKAQGIPSPQYLVWDSNQNDYVLTDEGLDSYIDETRKFGYWNPEDMDWKDIRKHDINKSVTQLVSEYEFGVGTLNRLRDKHPDMWQFRVPGVQIDMDTGRLIWPGMTKNELVKVARQMPQFQTWNYQQMSVERFGLAVTRLWGDLIRPADPLYPHD